MGLFDFLKKKDDQPGTAGKKNPLPLPKDAVEIADLLEKLGYFKYAEAIHLNELKSALGKGLAEHYLPYVEGNKPLYKTMDLRHYQLDGEDLFEEGGIRYTLKEMEILFEKMGIRMEISGHLEEYDTKNEWLDHEITINGKKYVIFSKFKGYGWGEAAQRFADMLNDQLERQQSDERLYLINGGNDGRAVFLTDEQYALICLLIEDLQERPLKMDDWCRVMLVERTEI